MPPSCVVVDDPCGPPPGTAAEALDHPGRALAVGRRGHRDARRGHLAAVVGLAARAGALPDDDRGGVGRDGRRVRGRVGDGDRAGRRRVVGTGGLDRQRAAVDRGDRAAGAAAERPHAAAGRQVGRGAVGPLPLGHRRHVGRRPVGPVTTDGSGPPPKPPAQVPSSVGCGDPDARRLDRSAACRSSRSSPVVAVDTATTHDPTVTSASVPSTVAENVVASVQVTAVCASVDRTCMTVPVTDAISPDAPPPPPGPERCGPSPCRVADVERRRGGRRRRRGGRCSRRGRGPRPRRAREAVRRGSGWTWGAPC